MYYNDYNRPPEDLGGAPWGSQPDPVPQPPRKKGGKGKVIALCLLCALIGGYVGGAVAPALTRSLSPAQTTIYESQRVPTVVEIAKVNGRNQLSVSEVYATNLPCVVGVNGNVTTNYWGQTVRNPVAGSGFVITQDGYILTNYHVIDGVQDLKVSFADGTTYDATLIGGEADNDIAVLKIDATGLTPVVVGDSSKINVGEQVVAIGNPLGELTFTLTAGYVSALDRNISMSDGTVINVMQTDAAINSGNSGGPLFNIYGECIGIINAKYSNNGSSDAAIEGIGFAIPIDDVLDMVTDIMEYGYVTGKPFLGVQIDDVDAAAQQYGIPAGTSLTTVAPGLAADKAGLKEGDILTAIGDTPLTSGADLTTALENYEAGDEATFTVYRDGKSFTVEVELDERNGENEKVLEEYVAQKQEQAQKQQQSQRVPFSGNGYDFDFSWPFSLFPW